MFDETYLKWIHIIKCLYVKEKFYTTSFLKAEINETNILICTGREGWEGKEVKYKNILEMLQLDSCPLSLIKRKHHVFRTDTLSEMIILLQYWLHQDSRLVSNQSCCYYIGIRTHFRHSSLWEIKEEGICLSDFIAQRALRRTHILKEKFEELYISKNLIEKIFKIWK